MLPLILPQEYSPEAALEDPVSPEKSLQLRLAQEHSVTETLGLAFINALALLWA